MGYSVFVVTGIAESVLHLSRFSRERSRSPCDASEGRAACTTITRLTSLADRRRAGEVYVVPVILNWF